MVQLTTEQRIAAVQGEFRDRFPEREPPAIQENVSKHHTFDTNLNLIGNSGRSRNARTPENTMRVRNVLQNNAGNISNIN